jgi:hypothetical protein
MQWNRIGKSINISGYILGDFYNSKVLILLRVSCAHFPSYLLTGVHAESNHLPTIAVDSFAISFHHQLFLMVPVFLPILLLLSQ